MNGETLLGAEADRFDAAIARRNRAWVRWRIALEEWLRAGSHPGLLLAAANDAQDRFEEAELDLMRVRLALRGEVTTKAA